MLIKTLLAAAFAMIVLLSGAVAWLIFDRFAQRAEFASLVSHVNALEEGVTMRQEMDDLAGKVEALGSGTVAELERIKNALSSDRQNVLETTKKLISIQVQLEYSRSQRDSLYEMQEELLKMQKSTDQEVSNLRKAILAITDALRR